MMEIRTSTGMAALWGKMKIRPHNARVSQKFKQTMAEITVKNSLEYVLDDFNKMEAYNETTRTEYRHILGMFGKSARDIVLECYWICNERRFNRLVQRYIDDED